MLKKGRTYRNVTYRYRKIAELNEVSGTGLEAIPKKYPYPRYCGRGYTGTRATGIDFKSNVPKFGCRSLGIAAVPNTPLRFGRAHSERIPPVFLVRTLPNIPLRISQILLVSYVGEGNSQRLRTCVEYNITYIRMRIAYSYTRP